MIEPTHCHHRCPSRLDRRHCRKVPREGLLSSQTTGCFRQWCHRGAIVDQSQTDLYCWLHPHRESEWLRCVRVAADRLLVPDDHQESPSVNIHQFNITIYCVLSTIYHCYLLLLLGLLPLLLPMLAGV